MIMCAGEPTSVQGLTPDADVDGGMKYPSSCGYIELRQESTETICVAWTELVPAKRCSSVGKSNNQCVVGLLKVSTLVCEEETSERQGADLLPIGDLQKRKPGIGLIRRPALTSHDSGYYMYYDGKMLTSKAGAYKKNDDGFYFKLEFFAGLSRPFGNNTIIVLIKPLKKSDSNHGEMVISADSTVVKAVSYSTSGVENVLNRAVIPKEDPNSCMLICELLSKSYTFIKCRLMSLDPKGWHLRLDRHGKLEVAKSPEESGYCVFDIPADCQTTIL